MNKVHVLDKSQAFKSVQVLKKEEWILNKMQALGIAGPPRQKDGVGDKDTDQNGCSPASSAHGFHREMGQTCVRWMH
eukprot:scaffold137860_cov23-Tisochrysis_lutea.AAC.4